LPGSFAFNEDEENGEVMLSKGGPEDCIEEAIASCPVECIEFWLESASGKHYAVLPPCEIDGSIRVMSTITHQGFGVASHYGSSYPTLPRWESRFHYDPNYYDHYYGYWQVPLPTMEMREEAISEGTLANGGIVHGFLYFEKIGENEVGVTFKTDLVTANDEKIFGTISIPLLVEQK